jgi:succinoglycan biosynthesis transport protein ExoP
VQLRALEREAKTQRDLLDSYLVKYREATARDSVNAAPPDARVISRATPAMKPAYPKKLPIVLIAAFAAFALSAGFTVAGALLSAPPAYSYSPPFVPTPVMPRAPAAPTSPQILSPPLSPESKQTPGVAEAPLVTSTVDRFSRELRQMAPGGVIVVGTVRNVGTTYAAIMLARALAHEANVVLVDLAFSSPNLSVISTEPNAPGIAELVRGTASFGDVITRDQYSRVHLVATGNVGSDVATLASSPMLATVIEALSHSYDHVVIDMGSASDVAAERFVSLATHAMLVAADPASTVTRTVRDRLLQAGFSDVAVIAGGAQAVAA